MTQLSKISGIGNDTIQKLATLNITTTKDIQNILPVRLAEISGIGTDKIVKLYKASGINLNSEIIDDLNKATENQKIKGISTPDQKISIKPKSPYAHYSDIEQIIAEMLTENTGMNVLDSGGDLGRRWQRNQYKDFLSEDVVTVEAYDGNDYVNIYFNLFHYLTTYLELDETTEKLENEFKEFTELPEFEDEGWLNIMENFGKKMNELSSDFEYADTVNTYNYDNVLGGNIQYVSFNYEDELYMLLQTHNGMDIRGGYSEPKIFKIPDFDYFIMAQNNITAYINENDMGWSSDDGGNNWYPDNDEPELEFDIRDKIVYQKGTNNEITFGVMQDY